MKVTEIQACRSCNAKDLVEVLNLGDIAVSSFVEPNKVDSIPTAPLELVLCRECSLLQLKHSVNPEVLYRNYFYRSFINMAMRRNLQNIADEATYLAGLSDGDVVLDIGCNDGTLLRAYPAWAIKVGFEPAKNFVDQAKVGTDAIINDFFSYESWSKVMGTKKARIVSSIAMFYDLEEPNKFVEDVKKCLARDGLWIIEMHYLATVLQRNAYDSICHEHLAIYSLHALKHLLDRHNMEILDVNLNDVNGGSFRIFIKHGSSLHSRFARSPNNEATGSLQNLLRIEQRYGYNTHLPYKEFADRVKSINEKVKAFLEKEVANGKKIYGYGASTKFNSFLQVSGIDNRLIAKIAERSPDKFGKLTVKTNIPIVSEEEFRRDKPDWLFVGIWQFRETVIERESEYLENGGKMLFALPQPRVIDKDGERPI